MAVAALAAGRAVLVMGRESGIRMRGRRREVVLKEDAIVKSCVGVWRRGTISVSVSVGPQRGFVLDDCVRSSAVVTSMARSVEALTQSEERGYLLIVGGGKLNGC